MAGGYVVSGFWFFGCVGVVIEFVSFGFALVEDTERVVSLYLFRGIVIV